MLHKSGSDATPLLEQLAALGVAAVRLGQDDAVGEANELFFQLTGISPEAIIGQRLADVLESSAVEHNAYGRDAAVYRFATPRGDRWLKPRWGRGPVEGVVTLSEIVGKLRTRYYPSRIVIVRRGDPGDDGDGRHAAAARDVPAHSRGVRQEGGESRSGCAVDLPTHVQ